MAALYLVAIYLILPSWKNVGQALKARAERRKINQDKKELVQIENNRKEDKVILAIGLTDSLSKIAYAKSNEEKIDRYYKISLAAYIDTFFERTGYMPDYFSQEPPVLHFFYLGISLTKSNNS